MKTGRTLVAIFILLLAFGCAETGSNVQTSQSQASKTEDVSEPQLYTAYNIWRVRADLMRCINYKYGNEILPAGTMVKDVKVVKRERDYHPKRRYYISFTTVDDNRVYRIDFTSNWHPGKTAEDYKNLMITTKPFEELTEGMTDQEIQAIKHGTVADGMSKSAVLVAYGYPPEHRTDSIYSNTWIYWSNKLHTFLVCFDDNDRTVPCR